MPIGSLLALYFVIWWVTLFTVLPFGIRSQQEAGDVVTGSDPGAPAKVKFLRIIVINSLVSLVVLAFFWAFYVENIFGLKIIDDLTRR